MPSEPETPPEIDIPSQYKKVVDDANAVLAGAVRRLWMIVGELGCDSYEVTVDDLIIVIQKKGK